MSGNVEHHGLRSIEDLKPASYNPRRISDRAARALAKSIGDFGDLSGIVWNKRTGNLVARKLLAAWFPACVVTLGLSAHSRVRTAWYFGCVLCGQ